MTQPQRDDAAERGRPGLLARLKSRILPKMPDFYALLEAQAAVTAEGTQRLLEFLRDGDPAKGLEVRRLEHEGDRVRARNLATLHRSFATPMDREDFYDAVMAVDEILNYAKTSVRELEILALEPDSEMTEMAALVQGGAEALRQGFANLRHDPEAAGRFAEQARKSERNVEKVYRRALAALFDPQLQLERLHSSDSPDKSAYPPDPDSAATLEIVTCMLKRREIYRHLSNASDHVAHAAQILQDIVNKAI